MTTAVAETASAAAAGTVGDPRSMQGRRMLGNLLDLPPVERQQLVMDELTPSDRATLFRVSRSELGSTYGLWQDDPIGFAHVILGQGTWSLQRAIMQSVLDNPRTAAPSAQGMGKTFDAAGLVLWHGCVWPVRSTRSITTATRKRQVTELLWPEIAKLHSAAGLPGVVQSSQWKMLDGNDDVIVSSGFTAPKRDESAIQGYHRLHFLVIIDEAGGIVPVIGRAFVGLIGSEGDSLLAIGNPPTDDEGSWFEGFCHAQDTHTIVLDAYSSPNFTGEVTPACRCNPDGPAHTVASHLSSREGAAMTRRDYGADSAYYLAKVRGRFPRGGVDRVIPTALVEAARDLAQAPLTEDNPTAGRTVTSRAPDGTPYPFQPAPGAWIRLGVDVASDGGDELAISRIEGDVGRIVHAESGPRLGNAVDVAGIVLREIVRAEQLAYALGTTAQVRVKVDSNGIGWGVCGTLEKWGEEGLHDSVIVRVNVGESIDETHVGTEDLDMVPSNKKAEMWLAGRAILTLADDGEASFALAIDDRTQAQLVSPRRLTNSTGQVVIEKKSSLKGRGLSSPDRAEALLLGLYEPFSLGGTPYRKLIRAGA